MRRAAGIALTACLLVFGWLAPASGSEDSEPHEAQFVLPSAQHLVGEALTTLVEFSNAAVGEYTLDVRGCGGDYSHGVEFARGLESGTQFSYELPAPDCLGEFRATLLIMDPAGNRLLAETAFQVIPNPDAPEITSLKVSASPFYPRVKDGYLDTTTVRARQNGTFVAPGVLEILDEGGRVLRSKRHTTTWSGVDLTWDGTDREGRLVATGTYVVRYTATEGSLRTVRETTVDVASASVQGTRTMERDSIRTTSRARTGTCRIVERGDRVGTSCREPELGWGTFTYRFEVPGNARNLRAKAPITQLCCHYPATRMRVIRRDKDTVDVQVKLQSWGIQLIRGVSLTYDGTVPR